MKNKKIVFSAIGILLVGLLVGAVILFSPETNTSYFYDEDVGIIESKVTVYQNFISKLFKPFQQAVTFAETEAEVGDTISFTDEHTISGLTEVATGDDTECFLGSVNIDIVRPDETIISFDRAIIPVGSEGETITYTSEFVANQEGDWTALTYYYEVLCNEISKSDCISTDLCSNVFLETQTDILVVSDAPPECDLEPSDGVWELHESIDNGEIEKRTPTTINDNCQEVDGTTEYRTDCDDGYQIVGTDGNNLGSGQHQCEERPSTSECPDGTDDECPGQICVNTECIDEECSDGDTTTITCDDNSTIITQNCVDSRWKDTNNECPTASDTTDDTTDDITDDTTDNTTDDTSTDDTTTDTTTQTDEEFPWILTIIVIILLIMGGVLGFIAYKRFKK